jgi:hypothetical protein
VIDEEGVEEQEDDQSRRHPDQDLPAFPHRALP